MTASHRSLTNVSGVDYFYTGSPVSLMHILSSYLCLYISERALLHT